MITIISLHPAKNIKMGRKSHKMAMFLHNVYGVHLTMRGNLKECLEMRRHLQHLDFLKVNLSLEQTRMRLLYSWLHSLISLPS